MRVIYKFIIHGNATIVDECIVKWLSAGLDGNGNKCVWAMVDLDGPSAPYLICSVGTGQYMDDEFENLEFIDTIAEGPFRWHIFVKAIDKEMLKEEYHKQKQTTPPLDEIDDFYNNVMKVLCKQGVQECK